MTSLLATGETVYKFEREQVSTWEGLEGGKKWQMELLFVSKIK